MATHKAPPTRKQLRRRTVWQRRIAVLLFAGLLGTAGTVVAINGTSPSAYGQATPFAVERAATSETIVSRDSSGRDPLIEGEWTASESDIIDTGRLVGLQADNPVVQDLANGRDKDAIPAGFDPNHDDGDTGNAYEFSECTWWAYVRRHQLGLPAGSYMGNGNQWADSARRLGYWVDNTPRVGDVMVFQSGQAGSSLIYGHVAIVEEVHEDGSITTSECGAVYNGQPFSRTFTADQTGDYQYIHY